MTTILGHFMENFANFETLLTDFETRLTDFTTSSLSKC